MFEVIGRGVVAVLALAFALAPANIALYMVGAPHAVVVLVPVAAAFAGKLGLDTFYWALGERKQAT